MPKAIVTVQACAAIAIQSANDQTTASEQFASAACRGKPAAERAREATHPAGQLSRQHARQGRGVAANPFRVRR